MAAGTTPYYVRSGATGTGDGSSWANAYTSLSAAVTARTAAGVTFWVSEDHNETYAAATTIAPAGTAVAPIYIICVNHNGSVPPVSADLRNTAVIATSGANALTFNGTALYVYGIIFQSGTGAVNSILTIGPTINSIFVNCSFQKLGTTAISTAITIANTITMINTTLVFSVAGDQLRITNSIFWKNTPNAVQGVIPTTLVQASNNVSFENVDLSMFNTGKTVFASSLAFSNGAGPTHTFKDCAIGTGTFLTNPGGHATTYNSSRCDSVGTNYRESRYSYMGTQIDELVIVRTGGATDGYTPKSRLITTNTYATWAFPFDGTTTAIWNDTINSITATMYGIWFNKTVVPTNDQVWFDIEYLGSSSTTLGAVTTGTKANLFSTGTALASSTKTWDSLAPMRANSTAYIIGQTISVPSAPGQLFRCTANGTSAATAPTGYSSTTDGASIVDGTATFQAGVRFQQTLTFTAGQRGAVYATPRVAIASTPLYIDPAIVLV